MVQAGEVIAGLHLMLDEALSVDLDACAPAELLDIVRETERLARRIVDLGVRQVAELESRRLAGEYARSSTADLLVSELRVTPADARARTLVAADLAPRRSLRGEPLPPLMPGTAAALAQGEVSSAHVRVIRDCLDHVPSSAGPDALAVVEAALVDAARQLHPGLVRKMAAELIDRLDPDGVELRDRAVQRRRAVSLSRNADGSGRLLGRLTPEATALLDTVFDSLAAPLPSEDGEHDTRSAAQRRHDALAEMAQRLLRSGSLPAAGGVPVTLILTASEDDVRGGRGVATSPRDDRIAMLDVLALAGDAEARSIRLDQDGAILSFGRARRLASCSQRLALVARDRGCTFPGCDRPAGWTEVHHVIPWVRAGTTDVDNLCLVCRYHHREFERRGWQARMNRGRAEWIPPVWIDPDQKPRRNQVHHLPDLVPGLRPSAA